MKRVHRWYRRPAIIAAALASACTVTMWALPDQGRPEKESKSSKATLSLKATPVMGFSPARIVLVAEIKGGPNDNEELYCAGVEWDWGDDTKSLQSIDCDPYEPGKSEIKRRFTIVHVYNRAEDYTIEFRLKRKDKVVASARTSVKIRPGAGEINRDREFR